MSIYNPHPVTPHDHVENCRHGLESVQWELKTPTDLVIAHAKACRLLDAARQLELKLRQERDARALRRRIEGDKPIGGGA